MSSLRRWQALHKCNCYGASASGAYARISSWSSGGGALLFAKPRVLSHANTAFATKAPAMNSNPYLANLAALKEADAVGRLSAAELCGPDRSALFEAAVSPVTVAGAAPPAHAAPVAAAPPSPPPAKPAAPAVSDETLAEEVTRLEATVRALTETNDRIMAQNIALLADLEVAQKYARELRIEKDSMAVQLRRALASAAPPA